MLDRCGRKIEYVRVSVTQNCNLRCVYCMPQGSDNVKACLENLTAEEIGKVVKSLSNLGIVKVRVTGGEPLLRKDICEIVERIAGIKAIRDISITTNGVLLKKYAGLLKTAGLHRVNISIDSLQEMKFKEITGGGELQNTLDGVKKALEVGLSPVKINTVLIKGINDHEVDDFIELTREMAIDVRFIELMPIGRFGEENREKTVYNKDIIHNRPYLVFQEQSSEGQPAKYYKIEGYQGRVGFISPMSHQFCGSCNRIRLTCDGKIRPCLGNNGEVSIADTLRKRPEELDTLLKSIIFDKPHGHHFDDSFSSSRKMNMIGG